MYDDIYGYILSANTRFIQSKINININKFSSSQITFAKAHAHEALNVAP